MATSIKSMAVKSTLIKSTLGIVLGGLAGLLALEVLFRVLPVSTSTIQGYHFDEAILTYPAHHHFVTATGWDLENAQRHVANNFGFVAAHEFASNPDAIAMIGDSFVEASMLDSVDRPAQRLEAALGGRPVFAFGGPGSSLLDYAERVRFAATRFELQDFVLVIEEGDVVQSACGSGQNHGRCFDSVSQSVVANPQSTPNLARRVLRNSALAQYLVAQLKVDVSRLIQKTLGMHGAGSRASGSQPIDDAAKKKEADIIIDEFLKRIEPYRGRRFVLAFEDRTVIDFERSALQEYGRRHFIDRAGASGISVVDLGPALRAYSDHTGLSIAVSPRDRHWNRAATQIVAAAIADEMTSAGLPRITN